MRPRLAVLLALFAVALVLGAQEWRRRTETPSDASVAAAPAVEPDRRLDFGDAFTRTDLEAALEAAYRLPPDRRMSGALGEISQILAPGRARPSVSVAWRDGAWDLRVDGAPPVSLAALPGFADGLAAAERWAAPGLAAAKWPAGAPEGIATAFLADGRPEEALSHLDDVAARSGITLALLEQALQACAQLSLVLREDRSTFADTTLARSLALLALTRAAGRGPHTREACTLAWAMGYTEEAAEFARTLPERDVIRALVLRADATLHDAAAQRGASRETRICDLLARARANALHDWMDALQATDGANTSTTLTPLATALAFHRFDVASVIGPVLVEAAFENVPGAPPRPRADSTTLAAFERLLARPEIARRGPLGGGAVAAARRALFYSGLYVWDEFTRVRFASPQLMDRRSRRLPADSGATWSWYARWQRHLAQDANGADANVSLRADLEDGDVPASFALDSYEALLERMPVGDGLAARSATRSLAARLDTRPRWALELALAAQDHVRWPTLTERLLDHVTRRGGHDQPRALLLQAILHDDRAQLRRLVTDPASEPVVAMAALQTYVGSDSSAAGALLPWYAAVAARAPRQWRLADAHADLLEARGRFSDAEAAVWQWLAQADSTQDALDSTIALTAIARLQRKQGQRKRALATIGDLDLGQQHGAMQEKARLLALTGSLGAALAVAKQARERYPQSEVAQAFPAELHWLAGRDDDAAAFVARLPEGPEIKGVVAASFASVFGRRHDRAERALQALRTAVPSHAWLTRWIMGEYRKAGDLEFAADLAEHAHPGSGAQRGFGIASAVRLITAARGREAARAWLSRQSMDLPARALASGFLTIRGDPEQAWALARTFEGDEYAWVMRAAAWRMDGAKRTAWADTVRAHTPAPGAPLYPSLTRYLLGELNEAEVLALADSPKHQAEVWYHCALMAWSEGRAHDALLWMVLCMETGSVQDGEYIWAQSALNDWCALWKVPEKLGIGTRRRA